MTEEAIDPATLEYVCSTSNIDLSWLPAEGPYTMRLWGHFDWIHDYFSILFYDIQYAEMCGECYLGEIRLISSVANAVALNSRWRYMKDAYSGQVVAIRSAFTDCWEGQEQSEVFIIVAEKIEVRRGKQWGQLHGG